MVPYPQQKKEFVVRRLGTAVMVLMVALVPAGCGGGGPNTGTMPTPAIDDGSASTTPEPTKPGAKPTRSPSPSRKPAPPPRAQVVVVPGRFKDNPAVQGFLAKYPLYFEALVRRDSDIIKAEFPAYFYADTAQGIADAKASGWVMRPPGSVVVVGVEQRPFGVVRIRNCRSQATEYWDPRTRKWARSAPKGTPDLIDMMHTGDGWTMYRWMQPARAAFSCASVRYPR
jgi:hypothetical protein